MLCHPVGEKYFSDGTIAAIIDVENKHLLYVTSSIESSTTENQYIYLQRFSPLQEHTISDMPGLITSQYLITTYKS